MPKISSYFLNGVIVLIPIAITVFVVLQVFAFTEWIVGRFLPNFLHFPGVALLVMLGGIVLIGWLSSHWIMKKLIEWGERLLSTIPGVKFIYGSVKKLSNAVFESKNLLKQAVLVPFPHPGAKALGFITSDVAECLAEKLSGEHVCVFIPMSLNLTAGFNILVPRADVLLLDVTSESALQYVLTAGAIMPKSTSETKV